MTKPLLMPFTISPGFTSRRIKRAAWPDSDRALYDAALKSLLRPPNATKRLSELSPGTRATDEAGYSSWLNFLAQHDALDPNLLPGDRINEARVELYVAALELAGVASKSIAMYLSGSYRTLRAMHPKSNWAWLCELVECVRHNSEPVVHKYGLPFIDQLFKYGLELVNAAENLPTARERAHAYRNGLLILLLAALPVLRRRNLHLLAFQVHLVRQLTGYVLTLPASERKDHRAVTAPVHAILTPVLDRYRDVHHPFLVECYRRPAGERRLWVARSGDIIPPDLLTRLVGDLTKVKFGRRVTPHMFRHSAAASYCQNASEHVADLPLALGHANLAMSEEYIWLGDQNIAAKKLDKVVSKLEK